MPAFSKTFDLCKQFEFKMKWRWQLRGNPEDQFTKLCQSLKGSRRRRTPEPNFASIGSLNAWTTGITDLVRRFVVTETRKAIPRARNGIYDRGWWNTSGLIKLAFRMLKASDLCPVPADKDSGFALVSRTALPNLISASLSPNFYYRLEGALPERALLDKFFHLCRRIAWLEAGDDEEARDMIVRALQSARANSCLESQISLTLKTHKAPGSVKFRTLHDCSRSPFGPLARWVNLQLNSVIASMNHIAKDTRSLLDNVDALVIAPSDVLMKADVKDYYMSGSHSELCSCASGLVHSSKRQALREAIDFLLENQFVSHWSLPNQAWMTIQGSGMGMVCSGNLADAVFNHTMEEGFITNPRVAAEYGLKFYCRCKDDVFLVLANDFAKIRDFKAAWSSRSTLWRLDDWKASMVGVDFLDVSVFKVPGTNRLHYHTHWKPSSLGVCLSITSAHLPSVHLSWMCGEIRRIARTCSTRPLFLYSRSVFIDRLRKCFIPTGILEYLQKFDPYTKNPTSGRDNQRAIYFALPYHPLFVGVCRHIQNWASQSHIRELYRASYGAEQPPIRVSWKLAERHLVQTLKRI